MGECQGTEFQSGTARRPHQEFFLPTETSSADDGNDTGWGKRSLLHHMDTAFPAAGLPAQTGNSKGKLQARTKPH